MNRIEPEIKKQFSILFEEKDWKIFRSTAEFYFKRTAHLKKHHIDSDSINKLLIRNSQKRLFLGIGCELLIKSFLLKQGYYINKTRQKFSIDEKRPYKFAKNIDSENLYLDKTYSLNQIIDFLANRNELGFTNKNEIIRGFRSAKVFRNKEAHVVTKNHKFEYDTYKQIENAIIRFYQKAFNETLNFQISIKPNQKPLFQIREKWT